MQNNNMSVTYCFLLADFLLGISAEKRDRETADSLPARGRGEAQESNGLHHVHDQCCCFQRSRRWAMQPTNQRKNPQAGEETLDSSVLACLVLDLHALSQKLTKTLVLGHLLNIWCTKYCKTTIVFYLKLNGVILF